MSAVVKAKTWIHTGSAGSTVNVSNTPSAVSGADQQNMLLLFNSRLLGFTGAGGNKPVLIKSCNGSTTSSSDTWSTPSDIVFNSGGSAHSYQQYSFPGMFGLQCLVTCDNPNKDFLHVQWSLAGFTGGTTTANPTATDVMDDFVAGIWLAGLANPNSQYRMHMALTDDGQQFRCVFHRNNIVMASFLAGRMADPRSGWTNPVVFRMNTNAGSIVSTAVQETETFTNNAGFWRGYNPSGSPITFLTIAPNVAQSGVLFTRRYDAANDADSAFDGVPVQLWSDSTPKGAMGQIQDFYLTQRAAVDGDTGQKSPNTPLLDWMVAGDTLFPWNLTDTPLVA